MKINRTTDMTEDELKERTHQMEKNKLSERFYDLEKINNWKKEVR